MTPARDSDRERLRELAIQALSERGLVHATSEAVERQVAELVKPAACDADGVHDLRELPWCSIDNDDSRDLDQLTVAEREGGGLVRVRVAVADVDALVRRRSPVDRHAQVNTTSIYTPAQVFPMLPVRLSEDLTSLNPGEDRVAVVTEMLFAEDGALVESTIRRAAVENRAQLAYPSVARWLDGEGALPSAAARVEGLEAGLLLQDGVAQALRARRHENGALDLATLEARTVFDGDAVVDLRERAQDRAQALIEDFMIAVNGVAARFLNAHGSPTLHRVVRSPERWGRIREVADQHGFDLPGEPDSRALNEFLGERRRADGLRFPDLCLVIVKLIGSGEYVVQPPGRSGDGHFGLAVRDYVHSTAPNRRYPDLLTQRLVKACLAGREPPYSFAELEELGEHCTLQEDEARRAERQLMKSAAALLLEGREGDRFDAVVTGASDKGTWVRILSPPAEGKLRRGTRGVGVGRKLRVELIATNVARGWLDFARVD